MTWTLKKLSTSAMLSSCRRCNLRVPEIVTFDELLERAHFIIRSQAFTECSGMLQPSDRRYLSIVGFGSSRLHFQSSINPLPACRCPAAIYVI